MNTVHNNSYSIYPHIYIIKKVTENNRHIRYTLRHLHRYHLSRLDCLPESVATCISSAAVSRAPEALSLSMESSEALARTGSTTAPSSSGSCRSSSGDEGASPAKQSTSTRSRQNAHTPAALSALELRRKRNRESMQRSRVREREELTQMRELLHALEAQYEQTVLEKTQQQQQRQLGTPNPQLMEYNKLADLSKQLKSENFTLQQTLESKRKAYERLERILTDYHNEKTQFEDLANEDVLNSASVPFAMDRISESEALQLAARCLADVERFDRTSRPTLGLGQSCFGWAVRSQVLDESNVYFLLTKTFPNLKAREVADRTWSVYESGKMLNLNTVRVVRYEVLQKVNENTYVIGRDIVHPLHKGIVFRSYFVRFRVNVENGFAIGRSCMNPSWDKQRSMALESLSNPSAAGIRYADVSSYFELTYLNPDAPDEPGCVVKFGGYCDYRTTFDLTSRFTDILSTTLQLEHSVLQPLPSLIKEENVPAFKADSFELGT